MKKLLTSLLFLLLACGTLSAADVTGTLLTGGSNGTNQAAYNTASITPGSNKLVLLFVVAVDLGGVAEASPTIAGNGLTWVEVATTTFNSIASPNTRVSLFRAMGASPSSGVLTITYASDQTVCFWSVSEFTNMDTGGANGADAIIQSNVAKSDSESTTFSVTLSAFANSANATYGAFTSDGGTSETVGSGFIELGGAADQAFAEYKATNDTTVDFGFSSGPVDVVVFGVEIKNATQAESAGASAGARGARTGFTF